MSTIPTTCIKIKSLNMCNIINELKKVIEKYLSIVYYIIF